MSRRGELTPTVPTAEQARTLYTRLLGSGRAWCQEQGYTVTGMQQFTALRPWRGATLLALSYGYLVLWCDREQESVNWHRGEVAARDEFWQVVGVMRTQDGDLFASQSVPDLPKSE